MKNKLNIAASAMVFFIMTIAVSGLNAQAPAGGKQYVEIKTSAICNTCKATIEKAVNGVDGVQSASLDLKTKIITVNYNADKTSAEEIKKAIVLSGYDADDMPADKNAYDHLDQCCKKE